MALTAPLTYSTQTLSISGFYTFKRTASTTTLAKTTYYYYDCTSNLISSSYYPCNRYSKSEYSSASITWSISDVAPTQATETLNTFSYTQGFASISYDGAQNFSVLVPSSAVSAAGESVSGTVKITAIRYAYRDYKYLNIYGRQNFLISRYQINMLEQSWPIYSGSDLTTSPNFSYSGTGLYYTPYDSVTRPWTKYRGLFDYTQAGVSNYIKESDWRYDPRFHSTTTGDFSATPGTKYYLTSRSGTLGIYSWDGTSDTYTLVKAVPSYAKVMLVMLQGAGGGGGCCALNGATSSYYGSGGGGGSGGFLFLAVPFENIYNRGAIFSFFAGQGGSAGSGAGSAGGNSYMCIEYSSTSYYWKALGGAGGGAGQVSYSSSGGTGGAGGSWSSNDSTWCSAIGNVDSYKIYGALYSSGISGITCYSGCSGGNGVGGSASSLSTASSGSGNPSNTIRLTSSASSPSRGYANCDAITLGYSGGAASYATGAAACICPGGGGSMLGAGGSGSTTSSTITAAGIGAGGRGGAYYKTKDYYTAPGAGGNGAVRIWWSALPVSSWSQVASPTVSVSNDGSDVFTVTITNSSSSSVTARIWVGGSTQVSTRYTAVETCTIAANSSITWEQYVYSDSDDYEFEASDYVWAVFSNGYSWASDYDYCRAATTDTTT